MQDVHLIIPQFWGTSFNFESMNPYNYSKFRSSYLMINKRMKEGLRVFVIFIAIFSLFPGCEEDDSDIISGNCSVIWRGFYHDWNYNHRVNRLGDWISNVDYSNGYKATMNHSAASGIGADQLRYKTFLSVINTSEDIFFHSGSISTNINGVEGTSTSKSINISEELPQFSNANAVVLLNGFDMYSRPPGSTDLKGDGAADKVFSFQIKPENISLSNSNNGTTINFDFNIILGADCASTECTSGVDNDWFDYYLEISYQIILAENNKLQATSQMLENAYEWARPINSNDHNEIKRDQFRLENISISGNSGYNIGFPGIRSIYFKTEKGMGGFDGMSEEFPHMLNLDIALIDPIYDADNGSLTMHADLFYKNWRPPIPAVSFGASGSVEFEVETILVQLDDENATIEHQSLSDKILWLTNPFDPSPPNISASLNIMPFEVDK